MADIKYNELDLKIPTEYKTFKCEDKEIEINDYLPIEDKYDIVMITLQKSLENGIYNPIKLDMYFHLNLIYSYTNIIFSEEDRENESKLFDEMKSTGFMDEFLKNINPDEYKELQETIEDIAYDDINYRSSIDSVIRNFIEDLPANAEAAQKIVENFDPEKFQSVIDFAKAANGGRAIK